MSYAICNETFEGWDHVRICAAAAKYGYGGLEIAPFTLATRITDVTAERRRILRQQANDAGLSIVGLHWLLAKTEGLMVTSPDAEVRRGTAEYLGELASCCRDLGGDLMVFGSPQQRRIPPGHSREQAADFALETFRRALPAIADHGVRVCLEPLAPPEADFLTTCAETVELLDRIGSPQFMLHQDVKAMSSEAEPIPELIRKYAGRVGHFHANDANRRGPGFGDTDFRPILRTLKETGYSGWVSVEVFDYTPDPDTIARESIRYLKECEESIPPPIPDSEAVCGGS
ncbi:MAG TPA: sugar phosphate isomerase/epimerase family protein [Gemmataceae bacterium]|jgi:sugar phosphate isomerase/epimerase|nr:sugar phosphate isomerase/epimerase family protein [Gemmataceae bacterium]